MLLTKVGFGLFWALSQFRQEHALDETVVLAFQPSKAVFVKSMLLTKLAFAGFVKSMLLTKLVFGGFGQEHALDQTGSWDHWWRPELFSSRACS